MNDAACMGIGDGLADLLKDLEEAHPVLSRFLALGQKGSQGAALDQLHGEVRPVVREPAQIIDGDDAGVLELAADLCLLQEPLHQSSLAVVLFQEDLDGQVATQISIKPFEDRAHAAASDLAEHLVAAR
jgi:hypothetical protein